MVDLANIKNFTMPRPEGWTVFGHAADFDALPQTHKDQILFLDKEASKYIWKFSGDANLLTGGGWAPFEGGNFRQVDQFADFRRNEESNSALKKWLHHRGILYPTWVFVLNEGDDQVILTTWKMVIKYAAELFTINDTLVFGSTLHWCLFFYHEDQLFFGSGPVYDATNDEKKMEELNERKKNYPQFRHPYL
jgi:hypothetical protein